MLEAELFEGTGRRNGINLHKISEVEPLIVAVMEHFPDHASSDLIKSCFVALGKILKENTFPTVGPVWLE